MSDRLASGASCGGSPIIIKKDIPVIFRVNGSFLEYSVNNGTTWVVV